LKAGQSEVLRVGSMAATMDALMAATMGVWMVVPKEMKMA